MEVSANLGTLSNHLDAASELGVGPAPTCRDNVSVVSPAIYQTSPVIMTPAMALMGPQSGSPQIMQGQTMPGLLASPVEQASGIRRHSHAPPINTSKGPQYLRTEPVTADFLRAPAQPPPLIHSHSFPNGHQLPSQLHGITPSTPMIASPSFTTALGVGHAPIISSPLATMPISRAPSPRSYPTQPWAEAAPAEMIRTDSDLFRRSSLREGRVDGRPVIMRSKSTSVKKDVYKNWGSITSITNQPSAWASNQLSSDEDEDEESEDELPKRTKRRRSSAKDDAPDPGFINAPIISDDIRRQLDQIFEEFLTRICSDRESS